MPPSAKILLVLFILASAALFTACFPPYNLHGLAWVALVPFLYAIRRGTTGQALGLAGLWGLAAAYGITHWLPPTIAVYYQQPVWLGFALFLSAAALMGAADYMAFAAFYRWAARRRQPLLVLSAPAAWVAAELGRARLWSGNPWGLLGYSQVGLADGGHLLAGLVQTADLAGVYGISFVLVSVNVALTEVLLALVDGRRLRKPLAELALCAVLVVVATAIGQQTLSKAARGTDVAGPAHGAEAGPLAVHVDASAATPGADATPVRVAVAQANIDLGARWDPRFYGRNLKAYLKLTHDGLTGAPQIVFWPENAMTFFVADEPAYRKAIATVTAPAGVELVAGAPRVVDRSKPRYYNSAFLLAPDGDVIAHYDKQHLLPFTEYLPLARFDYIRREFGKVRTFTPGPDTPHLLPTVAGEAGVVICNEAMFPRIVSGRVRAGAQYLVNLSNDSWIADPDFAEQQFDVVRLRAIETRRYLVRASTSGPSAVIEPSGKVAVRTEPFSAGTIEADIRPRSDITTYVAYGDLFAFGCLGWVLLVVGAAICLGGHRSE